VEVLSAVIIDGIHSGDAPKVFPISFSGTREVGAEGFPLGTHSGLQNSHGKIGSRV
jgi:hypothetical protein